MKKFILIKVLVVCIFIFAAYMICDLTKYYIAPITYEENEIRVILDDTEITKNLPDEAMIIDDTAMLSFNTIKKYFDKYIFFDEKYETVIITNNLDVLKMRLADKEININGKNETVNVSAQKVGDEIYIPISDLQEIYDIEVSRNEKIIITSKNAEYKKINSQKNQKIKLYKKEFALTTGKIKKGEEFIVFSGDENSDYVRVRTSNGDLGYIKETKINGDVVGQKIVLQENNFPKRKLNLTWEYAANYTPNRLDQEKIEGLDIISPTWLYVKNTSGDVKSATISKEYITWAKSKGYKLWPILKNDDIGLEKTSILITDMKARENLINNVVKIALDYGFDGINIDFENMKKKDKNEFSQFVREISATLRRNGIISSVDVNVPDGSETWSLCYDHKPISDACDYMMLMAYDQYGRTLAGPVASLAWVENNIIKVVEREKVDKNKLVLCVPFYSKYRKDKIVMSGDEETYKNISYATLYMKSIKNYVDNPKYKESITWDEEMGQYYIEYRNQNILERMWIEDEEALKEKVNLVNKYDLAGVASWRWGFETPEAWSTINDELKR